MGCSQANGLQGERDVRVGQTLVLPSIVSGTSHSAETVRPYDPTEVVGPVRVKVVVALIMQPTSVYASAPRPC
jgi:LysM repeat protein